MTKKIKRDNIYVKRKDLNDLLKTICLFLLMGFVSYGLFNCFIGLGDDIDVIDDKYCEAREYYSSWYYTVQIEYNCPSELIFSKMLLKLTKSMCLLCGTLIGIFSIYLIFKSVSIFFNRIVGDNDDE